MLKYTVKYYSDEIQVHLSRCLQENNCTCLTFQGDPKCCYTGEEVKKIVEKYYQDKVDYIKTQSVENFLHDQGFYIV